MADENNQVSAAAPQVDEDLDKIMKEISTMEAAITEESTPVVEATVESANVHKLDVKKQSTFVEKNTEEDSMTSKTPEQSLKLELTGSITLKLNFASGNRGIEIECAEDALICRLADGTEFRIPTGNVATKKKAA